MCITCVLWEKGKITDQEAKRSLYELIELAEDEAEEDHIRELYKKIDDIEHAKNAIKKWSKI